MQRRSSTVHLASNDSDNALRTTQRVRAADNSPVTLFDGITFDPAGDLEAYAKSFAIKNLKG